MYGLRTQSLPAMPGLANLDRNQPREGVDLTSTGFKLQTARMLLREFRAADAEPLFRLNSDPDVMRYTGESPFDDAQAARQFIDTYSHYNDHGFGRWAVEDLANGDFMGFCGLRCQDQSGEVDVAFRLFPQYWASGYATEAARACMRAGFGDFALDDILGYAMRENLPSITVLQKLGMGFRHMAEEGGLFWLVYGVTRDGFTPAT